MLSLKVSACDTDLEALLVYLSNQAHLNLQEKKNLLSRADKWLDLTNEWNYAFSVPSTVSVSVADTPLFCATGVCTDVPQSQAQKASQEEQESLEPKLCQRHALSSPKRVPQSGSQK